MSLFDQHRSDIAKRRIPKVTKRRNAARGGPGLSRIWQDCEILMIDDGQRARLRYEPSAAWIEYLLTTREKQTQFTCWHAKFYWQACSRCHRCPESARQWARTMLPKAIALLKSLMQSQQVQASTAQQSTTKL
jgi:hypothetical protein